MKLLIILFLLIIIFLCYFYRYPGELIKYNNVDTVYSPAYGKILNITKKENEIFIAIFLSPFDIHYQFSPIKGIVKDIKYDATNKFNLAYELNKSNENEKCIHTISNKHGDFKVYQIAGILVRRINYYDKVGETIETGKTIGLIEFGSRVDIIIPTTDKFNLLVKEGDKVTKETILGRFLD